MLAKNGLQNHQVQRQELRLAQQMIMSAHMQQAFRLLQLPLEELQSFIEEQVILNPILEMEDPSPVVNQLKVKELSEEPLTISEHDLSILSRLDRDDRDHFNQVEGYSEKRSEQEEELKKFQEDSIEAELTLADQLMQQARETFETKEEIDLAELLVGYIDQFGFLKTPLAEIALDHCVDRETLARVLKEIQLFEPYGVGASSLQESFLIQLRCQGKSQSFAYQLVNECYEELLHHQMALIRKKTKHSFEEIEETIEKEIAKLDMHPGNHFGRRNNHPIIPDVTLREDEGNLVIDVDRDYVSQVKVNRHYLRMLDDPLIPSETKHFIKQHLFSARWLMRNLQQRYSTLQRIVEILSQKQRAFFLSPKGVLHPLTMKMIAEELNLHESTIARTVANKYLYSPRGLFPLRSFFTSKLEDESGEEISSSEAKELLIRFIKNENRSKPLSDQQLSLLLKEKGIACARRTVAKYRAALEIGNTQQRRKFSNS